MSDYLVGSVELGEESSNSPTTDSKAQRWIQTMEELLRLGHDLLQPILQSPLRPQSTPPSEPQSPEPEKMEIAEDTDWPPPELEPCEFPIWPPPEPMQPQTPQHTLASDDLIHPNLWDLACKGLLPTKIPGLSQGILHLALEYHLPKAAGTWHCKNCHKVEGHRQEDCFLIQIHAVSHRNLLRSFYNPSCRCGASVARVVQLARCVPCQQITSLNQYQLHQGGQCVAVTPTRISEMEDESLVQQH